jgi:menaquinone-9 beta-reductase
MDGSNNCDILIIGGGLAGATLGLSLAKQGIDVLIVEKETEYRDRVRGEVLLPWGSVEAKALGIYDLLLASCAREFLFETAYLEGVGGPPRDFRSTTPHNTCGMTFRHPDMQGVLMAAAMEAGARVWRGAQLQALDGGVRPHAFVSVGGEERRVTCSLIVGADGRESRTASLANFQRERDPEQLLTGGLQLEGNASVPPHLHFFLDNAKGRGAIWIETKPKTFRAYLLHHKDALDRRLSGERDFATVVDHFRSIGVPGEWFEATKPFGLFATFDGAHRWITAPCRDGIVLIGDAGGCSDPVWGNGLSRTLRDTRLLRDRLLSDRNWHKAAAAYAADHDDFFHRLRKAEHLNADLYFTMGPDAAKRRDRAWELMEQDPELSPDMAALGPEARCSDRVVDTLLGTAH